MVIACPCTDATMKVILLSVLQCLLFALVEIHSQSVPYISFNSITLPNNSYVNVTLWREEPLRGVDVQCHTDMETCCNKSQGKGRGNWYYPSGHRLSMRTNWSAPMYQIRERKVVKLRDRSTQWNTVTSGMYRCDIETNAANNESRQTVYAGLYFTGGEFMHTVWGEKLSEN